MKEKAITNVLPVKKSYTASESLKNHIKTIHEGHRNHKCDTCGKYFTELGSLMMHIKTIHEGQRNFKCDHCGKFTTTAGNLKKHIQNCP